MSKLLSLLTAMAFAAQLHAAEPAFPTDGWASWQVEAVEDAKAFCCWRHWDRNVTETTPCDLESDRHGYGTRGDATIDSVRVYARFAAGKLERLRTLAGSCPVTTKTPIQDLDLSTEASTRWLLSQRGAKLDEDMLTSLALHRGDLAFNEVKRIARDDKSQDLRKQAIFWLALLRGTAGAEEVSSALFRDHSADIREHATFALSRSKSPRRVADLIRAGNTDKSGEVRGKAWFWLAESGASEAEDAIGAALRKDPDENVREEAILALAQLPDERATNALIAVAEDRSLSKDQRKRALFWLAQLETHSAVAYLDEILARTAR